MSADASSVDFSWIQSPSCQCNCDAIQRKTAKGSHEAQGSFPSMTERELHCVLKFYLRGGFVSL